MPDFAVYMSQYPNIPMLAQSALVARWIDERPSVITIFDRFGSAVTGTQTVRIEPISNLVREQAGENIVTEEEFIVIHGYKNATGFTNTDLRKGDRFSVNNMTGTYEVINVVEAFTDRLLVTAKVR